MRVCDKCIDATEATQLVQLVTEDSWFDLCDRHLQELIKFLNKKEKPKRKLF